MTHDDLPTAADHLAATTARRDADRREEIALRFAVAIVQRLVVVTDKTNATRAMTEEAFELADAFLDEAKRQRQPNPFNPLEITFDHFAVLQPDGSAPTFKATIQHKGAWYTIEAKMMREAKP